jgi:transcriptional regulator with XRE-family HTH domain
MGISQILKKKRKAANISQIELAYKIGISEKTVRRWESGERSPNTDDLQKLATVLDTSAAYLIGETNDPRRNAESQSVNTVVVDHSTAIGSIDGSENLSITFPEAAERSSGQNIIFERGEGPNKVRMILPATPETYAFLREQGEIGHWNSPQPPLATCLSRRSRQCKMDDDQREAGDNQ